MHETSSMIIRSDFLSNLVCFESNKILEVESPTQGMGNPNYLWAVVHSSMSRIAAIPVSVVAIATRVFLNIGEHDIAKKCLPDPAGESTCTKQGLSSSIHC